MVFSAGGGGGGRSLELLGQSAHEFWSLGFPRSYRRSTEGVDQRRVKPRRIHRLVQKLVCPGVDLALRRGRITADEKRWNFERTAERAAESFDGVDSGHSSRQLIVAHDQIRPPTRFALSEAY